MRKTIQPVGLAAVLALLLAGCASSGPTYNLNAVTLPDGTQAWRAQCLGLLEDSSSCFAQAEKVCGKKKYHVITFVDWIDRSYKPGKDPTEITFTCEPPQQAAAPVAPAPVPVPVPVERRHVYTLGADVLFPFGKSAREDLNVAGREALDRIAGEIVEGGATGFVLQVRGYTDRIGSTKSNLALSKARAQTVAAYLTERGIPENAISAEGMGEMQPVSNGCPAGQSAATIECLAPDRRVTIEVRRQAG